MALKDVKKILVINLGGIGDMLLSFPAVKAIRETYKCASLDIMVVDRAYEIVQDSGFFDNIFVLKKISFQNANLLLKLRRNKYDIAINMRTMVSRISALKIFLLMGVINPKIRAGRDTDGRGFFFDIKIPETLLGDKYESEYDIDIAEAIFAHVKDKSPHFVINRESGQTLGLLLEKCGVQNSDRLIGIHAGGVKSHRWPAENFADVIKALMRVRQYSFILTGDTHERSYVERLKKDIPGKVINLAGELSLNELGALINRCDLYIANDTGPLHIAAVLKRPLIAIFGPGYIKRFDPRIVSERAIVFHKPVSCAPCSRLFCYSMKCLKEITSREVIDAALKILSNEELK